MTWSFCPWKDWLGKRFFLVGRKKLCDKKSRGAFPSFNKLPGMAMGKLINKKCVMVACGLWKFLGLGLVKSQHWSLHGIQFFLGIKLDANLMVILRDFPYGSALFRLVSYNDPCSNNIGYTLTLDSWGIKLCPAPPLFGLCRRVHWVIRKIIIDY